MTDFQEMKRLAESNGGALQTAAVVAPRKNIKELFADFHGEYTPIEINWGSFVGEKIW